MKKKRQKYLLFLLILIQLCLVTVYLYYQKNYWSKDILRVAYLDSDRVNSLLSPYGPGFEQELVNNFCHRNGFTPVWIRIKNLDQGIAMVQTGQANLLIAGPYDPADSWENTVKGPAYMSGNLLIAHNRWRHPLNSINDLCSTRVVVPAKYVFMQKIDSLEQDMDCRIELVDVHNNEEEFFNLLSDRDFRFGLVDKLSFDLWHVFFPLVLRSYEFDKKYEYAWIWSPRHKDLNRMLDQFWADMPDDPYLKDLKDKYFGFFPSEKDPYQLRHFIRAIENHLPAYAETILAAAQENNIDPVLLSALIYQESHFDSQAESRTGVRGLLQLTLDTADFLGVKNRLDPDQSIMGGAAYLKFLSEHVEETGVSSWDKWFYTLAAYNQGLGHLYDAMELADRQGKNSLNWSELKEVYPLLSYTKYYKTLPRGYARGYEAVNFVENIRYYYYILHSMISLSRPEVEHLGGFLDFVPGGWPD
ncbi:MAG: transglycosylase SLT domain-containing protein [Desulfonatronovibrio sp.]